MAPPNYPSMPTDIDMTADKGGMILRTVWSLLGISTLVLGGRIWSKIRTTRRLYWDDGIMVLALIFGIIHAVTTTLSVHNGLGQHFKALNTTQQAQSIRFGLVSIPMGNLSPTAGRISFCVTLLFLTGADSRARTWPVWLFLAPQAILNVVHAVIFYQQAGVWLHSTFDPLVPNPEWNPTLQTDFGYFVGAFNCLTDAFLTFWPALLIAHTRLSRKRKFGLALILCLSCVALIASIVKTYMTRAFREELDYTWDLVMYVLSISVELNVVIIVASIPLLRPLFRRQHRQSQEEARTKWDTVTMGSMLSKNAARTQIEDTSTSSQENIVPRGRPYAPDAHSIHVTREVTVTYQTSDAPFVHAALVGLVQGEIANPHLVRR